MSQIQIDAELSRGELNRTPEVPLRRRVIPLLGIDYSQEIVESADAGILPDPLDEFAVRGV